MIRQVVKPVHPGTMLPLWDIVGPDIVTTFGHFVRGYLLQGLDSEHIQAEVLLQSATALYQELAGRIPEETFLQVLLECHSNNEEVLGQFERFGVDSKVLQLQRRRRLDFLRKSNLRRHDLFLFVGKMAGFSAHEFAHVSVALHRRKAEETATLTKLVESAFGAANIVFTRLCEEAVLDIFWRMLNPGTSDRPGFVRRNDVLPAAVLKQEKHLRVQTLREYLIGTPFRAWNEDHLQVGDRYHRVLTLRDLPAETEATLAEIFYGMPFDCWLSATIEVPVQKRYRSSLDRQRRLATADAGRGGNIEDYGRKAKRDEGEGLAALLASTGQRLVKFGLQAVITAANPKELDERTRSFVDRLRSKQLVMFEESSAHDREFFKTLPGMGARSDRHLLVTSNNAVDLLPLYQEERGSREPVVLLRTARGELFCFDPFEAARDNWNATIFGASGSGKSVFVNLLIASAVLAGPRKGRLMVIDYAGEKKSSYLMVAKLFGGEYIPILSSGDKYALNPFPPPERALQGGAVKGSVLTFLTALTDMLLCNLGGEKDEQLYRRIIQRGIQDTYLRVKGRAPIYSDLDETLRRYAGDPEVDQERLKVILDLMGGFLEGPSARLFNRPSTARDNSDFLILDLFGVDSLDPHVAQAVTFVATQWIKELAFDPEDPGYKYVILDEVAQLVRRPEMVGLVDELYSTSRKHRTSVWTVTQSYNTYRQSPLANTVKLNSTTQVFLSHASDERGRKQIGEDYDFQHREQVLFDSLRTVKGKYSEALIRTEVADERGAKKPITTVARVELSPLDYQICTSDAADREVQRKYIAANPELELHEVLEYLGHLKEERR